MPQPEHQVAGVKSARHRRFPVLDALVLIGAMAVGFGWTRLTFQDRGDDLWPLKGHEQSFYIQTLWAWSDLAVPCLTLWTIALSILWLRNPRRAFSRLWRNPGAVACAAVMGSLAVNVAFDLIFYLVLSTLPGENNGGWYIRLLDLFTHAQDEFSRYARPRGEAIAVCWCLLWASGRWRARATWLDRLSRVVAILWLVASVPHYWFSSDARGF